MYAVAQRSGACPLKSDLDWLSKGSGGSVRLFNNGTKRVAVSQVTSPHRSQGVEFKCGGGRQSWLQLGSFEWLGPAGPESGDPSCIFPTSPDVGRCAVAMRTRVFNAFTTRKNLHRRECEHGFNGGCHHPNASPVTRMVA